MKERVAGPPPMNHVPKIKKIEKKRTRGGFAGGWSVGGAARLVETVEGAAHGSVSKQAPVSRPLHLEAMSRFNTEHAGGSHCPLDDVFL